MPGGSVGLRKPEAGQQFLVGRVPQGELFPGCRVTGHIDPTVRNVFMRHRFVGEQIDACVNGIRHLEPLRIYWVSLCRSSPDQFKRYSGEMCHDLAQYFPFVIVMAVKEVTQKYHAGGRVRLIRSMRVSSLWRFAAAGRPCLTKND